MLWCHQYVWITITTGFLGFHRNCQPIQVCCNFEPLIDSCIVWIPAHDLALCNDRLTDALRSFDVSQYCILHITTCHRGTSDRSRMYLHSDLLRSVQYLRVVFDKPVVLTSSVGQCAFKQIAICLGAIDPCAYVSS